MKIILTRHTTTPWNLEKRLQGQTDIPIEEIGIKEAEKLADILVGERIDFIYSSDLKRASMTAKIIAYTRKLTVTEDVRLRECAFGLVEGHSLKEAIIKFGEDVWKGASDFGEYDLRSLGGESREQVWNRHKSFLDSIKIRHENDAVLIVGHGRSLNTLLFSLGQPVNLKRGEYRKIDY